MAEATQSLYSRLEALEKKLGTGFDIDITALHDEVSVHTSTSASGDNNNNSPSVASTAGSGGSSEVAPSAAGLTRQTTGGSTGRETTTRPADLTKPTLGVDPALANLLLSMGRTQAQAANDSRTPDDEPSEAEQLMPSATDSNMAVAEHPGRSLVKQLVSNASQSVHNAYLTERNLRHSKARGGKLSLGLSEDLAYVVSVQFDVLDEVLSLETDIRDQEALRDYAIHSIFKVLYDTQVEHRDYFLSDLERCCAAANDFYRLSEWLEEWANELNDAHPYLKLVIKPGKSERSINLEPEQMEVGELLHLYASDATYASFMTYGGAMQAVLDSSVKADLFSSRWEGVFTSNEVVHSLMKTMEEYRGELQTFLDNDVLYRKALDAIIRATIVFYVRCLVQRSVRARKYTIKLRKKEADARRSSTGHGSVQQRSTRSYSFLEPVRACIRVQGDIKMMKKTFREWTADVPILRLAMENEFRVLDAMSDCIGIAAGVLDPQAKGALDCITILYRKTNRDSLVVRGFLNDIWFLVVPTQGSASGDIPQVVETKIEDLVRELPRDAARRPRLFMSSAGKEGVPGLAEVGVLLDNVYGEAAQREKQRASTSSPGRTGWDAMAGLTNAISGITKSVAGSVSGEATVSTAGLSGEEAGIGAIFQKKRRSMPL